METRSSAERLSTATRLGLNSSMVLFIRDQVVLERHDLRVVGDHLEVPLLLELLEVEAPAAGVAEELLAALLEAEGQAALALGDARRR